MEIQQSEMVQAGLVLVCMRVIIGRRGAEDDLKMGGTRGAGGAGLLKRANRAGMGRGAEGLRRRGAGEATWRARRCVGH
eukprot:5987203-Pleurochrysis_carterae.AAC.2